MARLIFITFFLGINEAQTYTLYIVRLYTARYSTIDKALYIAKHEGKNKVVCNVT